ncbi:MAG: hypothetical protein ACD_62C00225G0002 [uncultured bacterium]|nr:MAG: hypothetical protein ACD_62C00225G0002 [uncultured bacterium]
MGGQAVMEKLYGKEYADTVIKRLNDLNPEFARIALEIGYDQFWARSVLSTREKSLLTIAALIAQGREEQTKIHMRGFLESGGKLIELEEALLHLIVYCGFPASMTAFTHLNAVKTDMGL